MIFKLYHIQTWFSSILGSKRSNNNGAKRRRKRKREALGLQQSQQEFVYTPIVHVPIKESSVTVYQHFERASFRLPCFYKKTNVFLWDSIAKFLPLRILPDRGYDCRSYSGLDVLELCLLISYGKVISNGEKLLDTQRHNFGHMRTELPFHEVCRECNHKCFRIFKGTLVISAGLNNSLKNSKKSFKHQNVETLFEILDNLVKLKFPRAKVVFVRQLRPNAYKWKSDTSAVSVFNQITEIINRQAVVIGCSEYGREYDAFDWDGIHLDRQNSETYFRRLLDQLHEKVNSN